MTRRESIDLTARVLAHVESDSLDIGDEVAFETRDAYISAERWRADIDMLRNVPHVIGWAGEVAEPGSYTTKDVMGSPVLVTRDRSGMVRAFINGCAHRGAQVAVGCGKARIFACPYHGWTYGLDGRLTGTPARRMFDGARLGERGLTELPVSEQAGLIVVGLNSGVDVAGALDDVEEWLLDYDFAHRHHFETRRFDIKANWKLSVSANFEGYHFPYLHRDSLYPFATDNSTLDLFGSHLRWAFPFRAITDFSDKPQSEWPDQFLGTVVYGLFPSCVLVEAPGGTQMLRVYPGDSPGQSVNYMDYGSAVPFKTDADRALLKASMDLTCSILVAEDLPAAEACQLGLESGVDHVVFGRNEFGLQHLASVWRKALANNGISAFS